MANDKQILNHIIDIKSDISTVKEHVRSINGSIERHSKKISKHEDILLNQEKKLAKWTGAGLAIIVIVQILLNYLIT